MKELTDLTQKLIDIYFPNSQKQIIINMIENECGTNLPLCENCSAKELEKIRFAAIKYSEGQIDRLNHAVKLAKEDWRDLLFEVGFAYDINAHSLWVQSIMNRNRY